MIVSHSSESATGVCCSYRRLLQLLTLFCIAASNPSNPYAPGGSEMKRGMAELVRKVGAASPAPSRPTTRPVVQEKFIPPKMSMVGIVYCAVYCGS